MTFPDYGKYDGLGLAELVRKKKVSPEELVEEAITRIETHNPKLNAVVQKLYDRARQAAKSKLPESPFMGVPFLIKDLHATLEGLPTSHGNRLWKNIPAKVTTELVKRWEDSGVIVLGRTNTPEFGLTPYTESDALGPALNPWDLTRTPGGSSGGSGAAVAARMVPLASGADGGGSIRVPSSACGLFGLKPTRGRTPTGPIIGESWNGFDIEHVITRSVAQLGCHAGCHQRSGCRRAICHPGCRTVFEGSGEKTWQVEDRLHNQAHAWEECSCGLCEGCGRDSHVA